MSKKSRLQTRIEYRLYRILLRAVGAMPDEAVLRWGTRIGALASRVLRGRDRLGMRNLRAAFPERREEQLLHDARAHGKGTLLMSGHFGGWEIGGLALMAHVDNVRTVARRLDNSL